MENYLYHQLYFPCYNSVLTLYDIRVEGQETTIIFLTTFGVLLDLTFGCKLQIEDFFQGCVDLKDYTEQIKLIKGL